MDLYRVKPQRRGSRQKRGSKMDYYTNYPYWLTMGEKLTRMCSSKKQKALWILLIYKNDRSMPFDKFTTNMQSIFTGFSENG